MSATHPIAIGRSKEWAELPEPAVASTNLRRLIALRLILLTGGAAVCVVAVTVLHIVLPLRPVLVTLLVAAVSVALTGLRLRQARPVRDSELFAQLVLDVLVLTALLYYTGGSTNPFASLYLIPLTLTAAALSWRYVWPMLALIITCYSLLLWFYVPLYHTHDGQVAHVLDDFNLHVVGTWLGLLLSGALIAYFAVRMRETVQERDRLRARMREQELRHERVLALGTFAAGAAHELSTPLTTIAVVTKELLRAGSAPVSELTLLRSQVDRCKNILSSLSAAIGERRAEGGTEYALPDYLHDLLARFREQHPAVDVQATLSGSEPPPRVVIDATLDQALNNVLNNAADVSADVEFVAQWTAAELHIEVRDRGPGLTTQVQEHAGEPFFTTKEPGHGLGLGLFLARSTLERLGGELRLDNHPQGGAVCRMRIPLTAWVAT